MSDSSGLLCTIYGVIYMDLYIKYACGVTPSHELDLTWSNEHIFSYVLSAENAKPVLVLFSCYDRQLEVNFLFGIYFV